jgi:predicted CXXCH cytochrome family protein
MEIKKVIILVTTVTLFMAGSVFLFSQDKPKPKPKPKIEANITLLYYLQTNVKDKPHIKIKSQGVPTVLPGNPVYLHAEVINVNKVKNYEWSLETPPGSKAAVSDPGKVNPTLVPDLEGQYKVMLKVTAGTGETAKALMWLTAATYVGDGLLVKTGSDAQCIKCHEEMVKTWKATPHAAVFQRSSDGKLTGVDYKKFCLFCHMEEFTGNETWKKVAKEMRTGDLGERVQNHPSLENLEGFQCESCHGPGSQHVGRVDQNRISNSMSPGVCGVCHDTKNGEAKVLEWSHSSKPLSMDIPRRQKAFNKPKCSACHTAQGYWHEILKKKESAAPYKNKAGLTCATCHDPHDARDKEFLLRAKEVDEICTMCHNRLVENTPNLYVIHPQGSILNGTAGIHFSQETLPAGGIHTNVKNGCVGCHMVKPPEEHRGTLGGHTFFVVSKDEKNPALNVNACLGCHETMNLEIMRASQEKYKNLLRTLSSLLPELEQKEKVVGNPWLAPKLPAHPSLTKLQSQAAINYYTIIADRTFGLHNPIFIKKLLEVTIKALKENNPPPTGNETHEGFNNNDHDQ